MKVKELIRALQQMDPELPVAFEVYNHLSNVDEDMRVGRILRSDRTVDRDVVCVGTWGSYLFQRNSSLHMIGDAIVCPKVNGGLFECALQDVPEPNYCCSHRRDAVAHHREKFRFVTIGPLAEK